MSNSIRDYFLELKTMIRTVYKIILCAFITLTPQLQCFNRSLFYRTSSFWDEPRFERPWLTSVDVALSGGTRHVGRNQDKQKVNILSIYGPENLTTLASLCNRKLAPSLQHFSLKAVADFFQADISFYQNFSQGFFTHFHLPIINLDLFPSWHNDESNHVTKPPKKFSSTTGESATYVDPLLAQFGLSLEPLQESALSDATLFFGWTYSYENTVYLDFIDVTLKTGVLLPTGKRRNENFVLDIPFGYNGHWGIPLSYDMSYGLYDWLTLGLHADAVFFFKRTACLRMKLPSQDPTGFIALGKGEARITSGPVWRTGAYIKADHFYSGLSFLVACGFEGKNQNYVSPFNQTLFPIEHVNKDERFKSWSRSMIHMMAEYDFSEQDASLGPRVSLYYNHQITGKRVFSINTLGGTLGLEINWTF